MYFLCIQSQMTDRTSMSNANHIVREDRRLGAAIQDSKAVEGYRVEISPRYEISGRQVRRTGCLDFDVSSRHFNLYRRVHQSL